jgi:hypothetical protein
MIKVLLQTTIPQTEDDWHIGRFSLVRDFLANAVDESGANLFEVAARDIEKDADGNDKVLSRLDESDFNELWLFAVDVGDGLTDADKQGIVRFQQRGGGLLLTRDHQDLGSCICSLGRVGAAHIFHTNQQDPDETRRCIDDNISTYISFHSGANGDFQIIKPIQSLRDVYKPLLQKPDGSLIEHFPAHPHEGDVYLPQDSETGQIIAVGNSKLTGRSFNLIIAFDREPDENGNLLGRSIAESSFHHFADYNWDTTKGCPTFVTEEPGDGFAKNPEALKDVKQYVKNAALWLANN